MKNAKYLIIIFIAGLFAVPSIGLAFDERPPEAKIYTRKMNHKKSFMAFENMNQEGGSVAVGDLGKDGKAEIVIGSGPGQEPWVYVYKSTGELKRKFLAYDINARMGVNVAVGNVRGKKRGKKRRNEIIAAPMQGGGPQVRIFDYKGEPKYEGSYFAFDGGFRGGVNVAACDTNGDGRDEVIASAGPGGAPHVRTFNGRGKYLGLDFRPFADDMRGGVNVACANVDGGREEEIITSVQSFGSPRVKVYKANSDKTILGSFLAYPDGFKGGVQITGGDMDKDGVDEVITAPNWDGGPHVRVFEAHGHPRSANAFAYEHDFRGGVKIAAGKLTNKLSKKQRRKGAKRNVRLVTLPGKRHIEGRGDLFKYIDVNLSEQRLRAYYNGRKVYEFPVSTGTASHPTPTGHFHVYAKIPSLRMTGFYGEGNPDNYDLENVPHVLAFYGDFTIHGAYWHSNWGHVMSHGCINEPLYEASLLYNWANVGDDVIVHY